MGRSPVACGGFPWFCFRAARKPPALLRGGEQGVSLAVTRTRVCLQCQGDQGRLPGKPVGCTQRGRVYVTEARRARVRPEVPGTGGTAGSVSGQEATGTACVQGSGSPGGSRAGGQGSDF